MTADGLRYIEDMFTAPDHLTLATNDQYGPGAASARRPSRRPQSGACHVRRRSGRGLADRRGRRQPRVLAVRRHPCASPARSERSTSGHSASASVTRSHRAMQSAAARSPAARRPRSPTSSSARPGAPTEGTEARRARRRRAQHLPGRRRRTASAGRLRGEGPREERRPGESRTGRMRPDGSR